jgi:hypothetical protein
MHPDTYSKIQAMIQFIKDFQVSTGCSPSYQEIGDHLGICNTYVAKLMRFAEARQLVRKPYGKRREIQVL